MVQRCEHENHDLDEDFFASKGIRNDKIRRFLDDEVKRGFTNYRPITPRQAFYLTKNKFGPAAKNVKNRIEEWKEPNQTTNSEEQIGSDYETDLFQQIKNHMVCVTYLFE